MDNAMCCHEAFPRRPWLSLIVWPVLSGLGPLRRYHQYIPVFEERTPRSRCFSLRIRICKNALVTNRQCLDPTLGPTQFNAFSARRNARTRPPRSSCSRIHPRSSKNKTFFRHNTAQGGRDRPYGQRSADMTEFPSPRPVPRAQGADLHFDPDKNQPANTGHRTRSTVLPYSAQSGHNTNTRAGRSELVLRSRLRNSDKTALYSAICAKITRRTVEDGRCLTAFAAAIDPHPSSFSPCLSLTPMGSARVRWIGEPERALPA